MFVSFFSYLLIHILRGIKDNRAVIIHQFGEHENIPIRDLKDLQRAVGGGIQCIPAKKESVCLFVDEEAIPKRLGLNIVAQIVITEIFGANPGHIFGPVVITGQEKKRGGYESVPNTIVSQIDDLYEKVAAYNKENTP